MSAMANATPIVTTVTKTTNKEKAPDATPRVNIQDFCEEHYENILPIIMEKARRDNPGQAGRIRETPLTVEVIPSVESVPEWKVALGASKNPMAILILRRPRPSTKIDLGTEDVDPFTPRIRNFKSSRKTRMPNNVKTYDGTGDPEDHLKIFQATAQVEHWAMPTWCHIFNSTLIGATRVWFDELTPESIDGYKGLKAAS
ncbi:hypothetical protein Tco_0552741 [Tanacetum coccineum]